MVDSGGTVLRLGGLYHLRRGAHNYWVCSGKSPFASSPDGLINLIHYDDAAEAVLCALKEKPCGGEGKKRQLYLVTDGVPISRKEIWYKKTIDLLHARPGKQVHAFLRSAAARRNPSFSSFSEPEFQGSGLDGKRYIVSRAKEELGKKSESKIKVQTHRHSFFVLFRLDPQAQELLLVHAGVVRVRGGGPAVAAARLTKSESLIQSVFSSSSVP